MSRTPAKVTQADVARAIRAAQQCGAVRVRIEPDGTIRIVETAPEIDSEPAVTEIDPFSDHPGYVYFVQGGPFIKIGWSLLLQNRIAALQTGNPYKLELLGAIPGSIDTEREIHERFKKYRAQGEWFADCKELQDFVRTVAR
jgi:hypothetical protein